MSKSSTTSTTYQDTSALFAEAFSIAEQAEEAKHDGDMGREYDLRMEAIGLFLQCAQRVKTDKDTYKLIMKHVKEFVTKAELMNSMMSMSSTPSLSSQSSSFSNSPLEKKDSLDVDSIVGSLGDLGFMNTQESSASISTSTSSSSTTQSVEDDVDVMRELNELKSKLGRMLLGDDVSGGTVGKHSALTITNAITNLAVACFGELKRLQPMSDEAKEKWNREIKWYLAPCEHIVERKTGTKVLDDGEMIEVLVSDVRQDLKEGKPKLESIDDALQIALDNFAETEFGYRKPNDGDDQDKWWLEIPVVPSSGLSKQYREWLEATTMALEMLRNDATEINRTSVRRMAVPEEFLDSLKSSAKKELGDSIYKSLTEVDEGEQETFDPAQCLDEFCSSSDKLDTLAFLNTLERGAMVWRKKLDAGSSHDPETKQVGYVRAQLVMELIRQRDPSLGQSDMEASKIKNNRDVGLAALEAYSRVLEARASTIMSRISDVLEVDNENRHS